jgi:hypothetical protein
MVSASGEKTPAMPASASGRESWPMNSCIMRKISTLMRVCDMFRTQPREPRMGSSTSVIEMPDAFSRERARYTSLMVVLVSTMHVREAQFSASLAVW